MRAVLRPVVFLAAVALASGCAPRAPAEAPGAAERWASGWKASHVEAEADLAAWVRADRGAAGQLVSFDREHPFRTQSFIVWAVDHPEEPLSVFVAPRSGWTTFAEWIEGHRRAVDAFVAWCRKHREAARELAGHAHGVATVGEQLYPGEIVIQMRR